MIVAITGHSGFIGRHLVKELKRYNHTIIPISREYEMVNCDLVYHLACPSSTKFINQHPTEIIDIIVDGTRKALKICPTAKFINISSLGAIEEQEGAQQCYNTAKRCMELYVKYSNVDFINYRLPSIYGEGMSDDSFIMRCVNGTAYYPTNPEKPYYIAHVDDVVRSMVQLQPISVEVTTLGEIYSSFTSGARKIDGSCDKNIQKITKILYFDQ